MIGENDIQNKLKTNIDYQFISQHETSSTQLPI